MILEAGTRVVSSNDSMNDLYLNGEYNALKEGRVSVEDRGFQFADGVYEVVRVYDGRPFRLREHLARLERSLAGVEIPLPEPLPKIEEICRRLIGTLKEATIYLQVTRGASPRSHAFPRGVPPTLVAYVRPIKAYPLDKTFSLLTAFDDRWGRCHLKTIALLPNVLAKQKAAEAGCDEALFVREDGTVTEGSSSNAFLVRAGALVTHPSTNRILNGITREVVLGLAREFGIPVLERTYALSETVEGDEFFMTGTTTEVMPVVSIDGKRIGSGAPGPITQKLQSAFCEQVKRGD